MPGVASPPLILAGFGFSAGSSYITTPIPFASQQPNPRASYTDGFPPQTVGSTATDPPDVRDFNGIHYAATANIAAFSAGQFFQFNSSISEQNSGYATGAMVAAADNSGWWLNQTSGNESNPDTSSAGSGWVPVAQYGLTIISSLTNANVTLTAPQAAKEIIALYGALTGNVQIIFPPWISNWLIQNNTTGAFTVTCTTASGAGTTVPQGVTTMIYGGGTNINPVGSSLSANAGAVANTLALRDSNAYLWAARFQVSSDRSLKKKVRRIRGALDLLDRFHGYRYVLKASGHDAAGLIAQEFREACPEGVMDDERGSPAIDPMAVVAVLTEALHEMKLECAKLARRLARLEKP
jgi:Chaperone of endosialidase